MASAAVNTLRTELDLIKTQIEEIQREHEDKEFPDDVLERWNRLNTTADEYKKKIELKVREDRIEELKEVGRSSDYTEEVGGAHFQIRGPAAYRGDPFDLSTVEREFGNPDKEGSQYIDRAKHVIEKERFPHPDADEDKTKETLTDLAAQNDDGRIARHMLATGSPSYKRAWGKYISGSMLSSEDNRSLEISRAASLTGTSGGFAVPFVLDPSIIPTSNLAINPYRSIARVVQISVDEWRGVSSAGITAAYGAEATAATDNSPTLAQPTISTEKAKAFVPFSIEIGQDWGSFATEMAGLLQDAKDELEATKFTLGSGTNEPFGVVTGATTVYTAAATNALVIADVYGWSASLGPRFRPRGVFVMNGGIANRVRQFDTAGGAGLWIDNLKTGLLSQDIPTTGAFQANLLGRPAYESSAMSQTMTTGQLIGVYGDFNYYVIVDRIGMNVETIPHLFDVTNNMPTGQRGLFAYWRNGAKVVDANAFRTLKLA